MKREKKLLIKMLFFVIKENEKNKQNLTLKVWKNISFPI
jgi:hypothetical protein